MSSDTPTWLGSRVGWVYLIRAMPGGPIKVGWALSVSHRLEQLQAGNHRKLKVIAKARGTRRDESAVHMCIEEHHIRGDWFKKEALADALDALDSLLGIHEDAA